MKSPKSKGATGQATLTGNGFPWLYAQKVRSEHDMGTESSKIFGCAPVLTVTQMGEMGLFGRV